MTRKAAAITAAVDAIEAVPGQSVTAAVRACLAGLYDQAAADTRQENPR